MIRKFRIALIAVSAVAGTAIGLAVPTPHAHRADAAAAPAASHGPDACVCPSGGSQIDMRRLLTPT